MMSFAPIVAPAGTTAVMVVELTTTKLVTATLLMVAPVAPVKPVPVIVIDVAPSIVPEEGDTDVTWSHCA